MFMLKLLWAYILRVYYTRASEQINPMHPDVGHVALSRLYWEGEVRRLTCF
jgi:hypothetical protein